MFSPAISVLFVLAFVASQSLAYSNDNQTVVEIATIGDIHKFKNLPQGAELILLKQNRQPRGSIIYTLGKRVSNDRLVSQSSNSKTWNTPQNVRLSLEYPVNGTGALITCNQIFVNQSSLTGRAYVVSGGIRKRSISVIVEAKNTTYFRYVSELWGL